MRMVELTEKEWKKAEVSSWVFGAAIFKKKINKRINKTKWTITEHEETISSCKYYMLLYVEGTKSNINKEVHSGDA